MDQIENLPDQAAGDRWGSRRSCRRVKGGRRPPGAAPLWRRSDGCRRAGAGRAGRDLTAVRRVPPSFAPGRQDFGLGFACRAGRNNPQRRFYAGTNLDHAVTVEDLRAMAHRRLPGFVIEYLEAGGEDEAALARNIAALAEWRFLHRSLVDVSHRDVSTMLFGRKTTIPVAVAPTGFNGLFWPHADLRLAEAAAEGGGAVCSEHDVERPDVARRSGAGAAVLVAALRIWADRGAQRIDFESAGQRLRGADRNRRCADIRQSGMA